MEDYSKQHIYFVDDEPNVRKIVARTIEQLRVKVTCFASGADCLEKLALQHCDLLITDVKMPKMDGIELLTAAKKLNPSLQVLVITGYGDIPMAVRAVKAGALDFIEKPLDRKGFLSIVESVLRRIRRSDRLLGKTLTAIEIKVLRLVLEGKTNKQIANSLHRSIRTVEDHRSHIMRKLGVDNLVDLVKKATIMGLVTPIVPK